MKTSAASLPALKTRRRYFEWRTVWLWVGILGACVGSGVFYGAVSEHGRTWIGAVYGLCCGGSVMLFEQGVVSRQFRERLRRLPWLLSILATEVVYVVMVMAGAMLAGLLLSALGLLNESLRDAVLLGPTTIIYSLAVSGVIVTLLRMRDLVGAETFRNILLGRYHYPAKEERIFVFVDLIGSTAYAQAHGDLEAQRYLGAIFTAMAEPVRRYGGAINDYIGDMAMLTWPLAAGAQEARCVACVFAFLDAITKDAETWRRDFGEVPCFRAAFHGGEVVTAEIGVDRHKISYFGDVVNTTGRIEALCRTLDTRLLISLDLLDRIPALPQGIRARPLGEHAVRGRGQMLTVLGLEPFPPTPVPSVQTP